MSPEHDASEDRPTVYYDGACGVCSNAASFIRKHDRDGLIRLVPIQSDEAERRLTPLGFDTKNPSTMVLARGGRVWSRSDSALRIAGLLGLPWSLARVFFVVPRPIRDAVYTLIARNRHRLPGSRSACPLPLADNSGHAASGHAAGEPGPGVPGGGA